MGIERAAILYPINSAVASTDASGRGHAATFVGSPTLSAGESGFGNRVNTSNGNYISSTTHADFDFNRTNWTCDCRIKTSGVSVEAGVANVDSNALIQWFIGVHISGKAIFGYVDGLGALQFFLSTATFNDNVEHWLRLTKNGTALELFVDGVSVGTHTIINGIQAMPAVPLTVGDLGGTFAAGAGSFDEFRLSDIVRSDSTTTPFVPDANTLLLWHFDYQEFSGTDMRLLDDAQAGATDSDQSVRFTHTQDGQERTFDPDNALVTTETDPLTLQGEGWALRLAADMTPADDVNCNAMLTAGTLTVNVRALLNMNGGTNLGGDTVITFRASLWRYNVSANTAISVASGSQAQTWDTTVLGAENNTRKNTAISISIAADVEFLTNEILFLQIGCEGTTLPNASLGTTNFDVTLDVDDSATNITFAAGQGIRQWCRLTGDTIGKGTVTHAGNQVEIARSVTGKGTATESRAVVASKSFDLVGKGTVTHTKFITEDFDLTGKGTITESRAVVASKSFGLVGLGTVSKQLALALFRNAVGKGTVTSAKTTVASKSFDLVGKGVITEVHPVQAFRSFALVGKGEILTSGANGSTITLPIDELPTGEGGGGTPEGAEIIYFGGGCVVCLT